MMSKGSRWQAAMVLATALALPGVMRSQTTGVAGKTITVSGGENNSGSVYDTGTVGITINGYAKTFPYAVGQYASQASVASYIAAHISMDTSETVWAQASGTVITLVPRIPGGPINITYEQETPTSGISTSFFFASGTTTTSPSLVVLCDPTNIGPGQTTNCTATIDGGNSLDGDYQPNGTVAFQIGTSIWSSGVTVNFDGTAVSAGLSSGTAGTYTITAVYSPGPSDHYSTMSATTSVKMSSSDPVTSTVYNFAISTATSGSGYDGVGNVIAFYDSVMGQWDMTTGYSGATGHLGSLGYDQMNRLVAAKQTIGTTTTYYCWSYDNFGNRINQSYVDASSPAFTDTGCDASSGLSPTTSNMNFDDSNRIEAGMNSTWHGPTGSTVTMYYDNTSRYPSPYDASGNLIYDGTNYYAYDAQGQVCAVGNSTSGFTGYIYNAAGIRVGKGTISNPSVSTDEYGNNTLLPATCDIALNEFALTNAYVLGPDGQTMTETDGSGTWLHTDVIAGTSMVSYDADSLHFGLSDWLGTRKVQAGYDGSVEKTFATLPYGEMLGFSSSGDATEKHFTGKEHDVESGNDYFGARYYPSGMGRFLIPDWSAQADPVPYAKMGDPQTLNLYSYVTNNPLSLVDANGHVGFMEMGYMDNAMQGAADWADKTAHDNDPKPDRKTEGVNNGAPQAGGTAISSAAQPAGGQGQQGAQQQSTSSSTTTQTQSTDYVSVSYWPKGAGGFGHIGIGVDTDDTQGYSTKDRKTSIWKRIFGAPVGAPEDDIQAHTKNGEVAPHSYLHIPISADQAAAMRGAMDARTANGGRYNLIFNNCAQFVESVLHAGGVSGVPHAEVFGPAILGGILWAEH